MDVPGMTKAAAAAVGEGVGDACVRKSGSDAPGSGLVRDTYGGHGAILNFLDLLTDRGESEDTGLDHGAIGTARCQRRACYAVRYADSRLNSAGGCNGSGRSEGCGYSDRGNLTKGEIG